MEKKFTVCIVGGGSRYTPGILKMLANNKERFPMKRLVLYDNEPQRQEKVGRFGEILFREYYPECEISWTTDPDEAFKDLDFAFMQIRAGRLAMREKDEKIAMKHGCVGQETCGPGGFAYGMRSVPAVCELVRQIRALSPEAWILNYSNPAAIVAEATKRVFPDDHRLINICDMPIGIMGMYAISLGVDVEDLEARYYGLNHFGWFTHVYNKHTGEDYLPKLRELYVRPLSEQLAEGGNENKINHNVQGTWMETFNFMSKMIQDYPGTLPNTYLQYYLYPKHMFSIENPEYTRANEVMDGHEKEEFERMDAIIALGKLKGTPHEPDPKAMNGHAGYIVDLAYALSHNTKEIFLCMVENHGIVANLTEGMMVEVPCLAGANGLEPLNVGNIPTFQKGLLENQFAYEKLTVDACLEGSYLKAWQALTLNRCVNDTDTAKALLDDYIEANKEYWPELK